MLKSGIKLNKSYLGHFEDRHPDVIKRDSFYDDLLTEDQMKEKMLMNPKKYIRCTIQLQGSHEAFCTPVDNSTGISIIEISGRSKIGQVFNEDEVLVEVLDNKECHEKRFGKVLGILNRQRHKDTKHPVFICTLDDLESHLVRPMCGTIPKIHILNREVAQKFNYNMRRFKVEVYNYDELTEELCEPRIFNVNPSGQKTYVFLVAKIAWSPRHVYPIGAIVKILQWGNSIPRGLAVLNLQHEVPSLYKKTTVERVEMLVKTMERRGGGEPDADMLNGRVDLTGLNTITIDPAGSCDLDDALSIEQIDEGYRVGVHIADVSEFVQIGDPTDIEAYERATTFYPGIRRPRHMIPEPLSSDMCSLLCNKKRLTVSISFLLDSKGRPIQMEGDNYKVELSFIKSKKQLSYEDAQRYIKTEEDQSPIAKDIRKLHSLAKHIRMRRLGNAMFAVGQDWEESLEGDGLGDTVEAHYLVEEFMIMANEKVAQVLNRKYQGCFPIRRQPAPNEENLQEFVRKNGVFIDLLATLQSRTIIDRTRGADSVLSLPESELLGKDVIVSKGLWAKMEKDPVFALKCLQKDSLFPIQNVVYKGWIEIQQKAGYHCFASLKKEDQLHFSLQKCPYTHFTSPIRRYNDLIVHRMLKACIRGESNPYNKSQIDQICIHINSMNQRSKAYQRGCRALEEAVNLQNNPEMMTCYVDDVTDRGLTLGSAFLRNTKKAERDLPFNQLDMGHKPEIMQDNDTNWDCAKATWRKRLYDFKGEPILNVHEGDYTQEINPQRNALFIPVQNWAKIVNSAAAGAQKDLEHNLKMASKQAKHKLRGVDDVSTETLDPAKLQPSTKFTMKFFRGQSVNVQMTAGPKKGLLAVKPMLYKMTNNINFCLLHNDDPVLHLFHYVTTATCDKYKNVRVYLARWLPLILMEAAEGIVRNEESCVINNVPIKFTDCKGKFNLNLAHCETRNIELSGTESDDEDDLNDDENSSNALGSGSYDWLCIKAELPGTEKRNGVFKSTVNTVPNYWVAHAAVTKVIMQKEAKPSGKISVSFDLHEKSANVPPQIMNDPKNTKYSVEILRKSEVDR